MLYVIGTALEGHHSIWHSALWAKEHNDVHKAETQNTVLRQVHPWSVSFTQITPYCASWLFLSVPVGVLLAKSYTLCILSTVFTLFSSSFFCCTHANFFFFWSQTPGFSLARKIRRCIRKNKKTMHLISDFLLWNSFKIAYVKSLDHFSRSKNLKN